MYNWNTPKEQLNSSEQTTIWKLNQLVNFGLNGEKIDYSLLSRYWNRLSLDPKRKKFLEFLLWDKLS